MESRKTEITRLVGDGVTVIELFPRESECFACGTLLVGARLGIPVYEDLVLPNDWTGEWFGHDACARCYEAQQSVTQPTRCVDFLASMISP